VARNHVIHVKAEQAAQRFNFLPSSQVPFYLSECTMPHVAEDVHSCGYCARIAISEEDSDGNKPWFFDGTHIAAPKLQESAETCPLFGVIPDISMDCEAVTGHTRSVARGLRILVQDWVPWNLHIHSLPGTPGR